MNMSDIKISAHEEFLAQHPGVAGKSPDNECLTEFFIGSLKGTESSTMLDSTVAVELGKNYMEGNLFFYRACGVTACKRECGIVINDEGIILDAKPFSGPCIGKEQQ
jgi:hypothetical protein